MPDAEFRQFLRKSAREMRSHSTVKRMGFDVARFSNEEVRRDIDAVCERILRIAWFQA